jgi:hypothetical protein
MATIGFPLQDSFRSAWVMASQPIIYQTGLASMGYQGITDNSTTFGTRKSKKSKKSKATKSKKAKKPEKNKNKERKKYL